MFADLERRAFDYFWYESHPTTGLVKDRAGTLRGDDYHVASLAATGFGLSALTIGAERGWVKPELARARAELTLRFVLEKMTAEHGVLPHFVEWKNGERAWKSEFSSIDTALYLAGALLAGQYFGGEVDALAQKTYERVEFQFLLTDGGAKPEEKLLSHGWKPESGFLATRWDNYSEHLILNLLAIGSPTHAIPPACWSAWERNIGDYKSHRTFACGPLFTHQYSQLYIDVRGRIDASGFDYYQTAVEAHKANHLFCREQSKQFKTYGNSIFGLSACDGPSGYQAYGAPPALEIHDGTIAPWSAVAAMAFTPELASAAVDEMRRTQPQIYGRYGFANGYNLDKAFVATDVIGIDLGAALLALENYRSGFVWQRFLKISHVSAALEKAGFKASRPKSGK